MTDEEIKKAFALWRQSYEFKSHESSLHPFLNPEMKAYSPGDNQWLANSRKSLFLSTSTLAERMKVSRSAYWRCERGEATGAITMAQLAKAAEAMDCELVYAIRPNSQKLFSVIIWGQLLQTALQHPWLKNCDQRKRVQALLRIIRTQMRDPKFRKSQSWTQRLNQ